MVKTAISSIGRLTDQPAMTIPKIAPLPAESTRYAYAPVISAVQASATISSRVKRFLTSVSRSLSGAKAGRHSQ